MPRLFWIAAAFAAGALVGAIAGATAAVSCVMDTTPLAPWGFDYDWCPDTIPVEWMD